MTRRFTVIQGGREGSVAGGKPSPLRLEAVAMVLRRRLADLKNERQPFRVERAAPIRGAIPDAAFLGVRPEGWSPDVAA
ncbi:hypothetical protein ACFQE0_23890 [Methylobacterium komagatae]|uniref:Uncharacterized protein n=1 Tax=Methylobacterium komagatae TaxID=374425 RepID=A0ABW2BQP8_9HYPH